ncbi:hypothetical protein V6N11_016903 [Hibiscus sabdariffa]|uniref:Uncharacterized protein n=1 Tax=Hibiscus sabdariffa TaxID=183260 RepID=A0ABR2TX89_9ROSI
MIEANTIGEHLRQNDRFDMVFYHPAVDLRHVVTDYNAFKSRVGFMVMMALKDGNYNIIGSYGMGGVGNIILMEEIARRAKEKQLFDELLFVTATQIHNEKVLIILDDIWVILDLYASDIHSKDQLNGLKIN